MKTFFTILIVLLVLAGAYYIFKDSLNLEGWFTTTERVDSVYLAGDTIFIPVHDTVWAVVWKYKPATTETIYVAGIDSPIVKKSSEVDTTLVNNQDTISVKAKVDYFPEPDYFDWFMDIEHKDYDLLRVDTIKVNKVERYDNPLWIIATIITALALFASLIFGG